MKGFMLLVCVCVVLMFIIGCGGGGGETITPPTPPAPVAYQLYGINFGPYITGSPSGGPVPDQTVTKLLHVITPYARLVRVYTTFDINTLASRLGKSLAGIRRMPNVYDTETVKVIAARSRAAGLETAIGCWLSNDLVTNEKELANLISLARLGNVDLALIGSEALYRHDLTAAQLIGYINRFKAAVPGVPVVVADDHLALEANQSVIDASDQVWMNDYPVLNGVSLKRAAFVLRQDYLRLKAKCGAKELTIGETGLPSGGDVNYTPANEAVYFINIVSMCRAEGYLLCWFEAFDEPWKEADEGPRGSHWGIWDVNLTIKPGMMNVFDGKTVPDNWTVDPDQPIVLPSIAIADVSFPEGNADNTVKIPVTLDKAGSQTITVKYATTDLTATAGIDYTATTGTLTFPAGTVSQNISLGIRGDTTVEPDETLKVTLSSPQNATLGSSGAVVTIKNDDQAFSFSGKIVFGAPDYNNGTEKTWIVTKSGQTSLPGIDMRSPVVWSPDGQKIYCNIGYHPAFVSASGAVLVASTDSLFYYDGSWTSDGQLVLAGVYFDGLYGIKPDGTTLRLLGSAGRTFDHCPTVSRDGQWVAFLHHEYGNQGTVYRVKTAKLLAGASYADCENIASIVTDIHDEMIYLDFSNDGRVVVAYGTQVDIVDPVSKQVSTIATSTGLSMVRLSPDGSKIALSIPYGGTWDIEVVDLSGNHLFGWASESFEVRRISWSPDSTGIAIAGADHGLDLQNFWSLRIWPIITDASYPIMKLDSNLNPVKTSYGDKSVICAWSK